MAAIDQHRFPELDTTLASLVDLLHRLRKADQADWIEVRRGVLRDPAQPSVAKDAAVQELRGIISGMGSLLDLNVADESLSRERDDLADRLYVLTRPPTDAQSGDIPAR